MKYFIYYSYINRSVLCRCNDAHMCAAVGKTHIVTSCAIKCMYSNMYIAIIDEIHQSRCRQIILHSVQNSISVITGCHGCVHPPSRRGCVQRYRVLDVAVSFGFQIHKTPAPLVFRGCQVKTGLLYVVLERCVLTQLAIYAFDVDTHCGNSFAEYTTVSRPLFASCSSLTHSWGG